MQKIIRFLIAAFVLIVPLHKLDFIKNISIFSFNPITVVIFLILIFTIINMLFVPHMRSPIDKWVFLIGVLFIFSVLYSIVIGNPLKDIFLEIMPYMFALCVAFATKFLGNDYANLVRLVCYSSIMASLASILIGFNVIALSSDILKSNSDSLLRTAIYVDGGMGVLGIIAGTHYFYCINEKSRLKKVLLSTGSIAGSIIILVLGQSRTRIALGVIFLFISILYYLFYSKRSFLKTQAALLIGIIILAISAFYFSNYMQYAIEGIRDRFESISSEDISYIFREIEANTQIQLALQHPLLGIGWGIKNLYFIMYSWTMGDHNMYTSLLAKLGIPMASLFFIFLSYILLSLLFGVITSKTSATIYFIGFQAMLFVLLMGITSAGISQYSSLIAMLLSFYPISRKLSK